MKRLFAKKIFGFCIAAALLAGCAYFGNPPTETKVTTNENLKIRNNAASLLYQLLEDEKHVGKLLIIKREKKDFEKLIERISKSAQSGAHELERLKKTDATLDLEAAWLPEGERRTREAISKTRTSELLRAKADDFEYKLLLTQLEALSYGWHLAKVAAAHEPGKEQAAVLSRLSSELEGLYHQTSAFLRNRKP